ncbi:MAG: hypothetical protein EXR86_02265 [Gammaproteobacteria bacterium]|nr:hypothetical protein [Gammaproteobacteria bacterium]
MGHAALAVHLMLLGLGLILLVGCTQPLLLTPHATRVEDRQCLEEFRQLDEALARSGLRDSEGVAPSGIPYLRIDRFLASYASELSNHEVRSAWLAAAAGLDASARAAELANVASLHRGRLPGLKRLAQCRAQLVTRLMDNSALTQKMAATEIPDEYSDWGRVLGLYPLAAHFARAGIRRLHRDHPVTTHALSGSTPAITYRWPTPRPKVLGEFSTFPRDALGRVQIGSSELAQRFALHAPLWTVASHSDDDQIGQVLWRDGRIEIDTSTPVLYHYASFTRFAHVALLQLNYVVWFPARTAESRFDLLAGHLDGMTWRVTLDADGTPLLYEAMHNCGCYHQFYPTDRLRQRPQQDAEEPLWVPMALSPGPLALTLAAGTHYVLAITNASGRGVPVALRDYDELRSLPYASSRRGLFGNDGIVWSSSRTERFVLWPLGVPAPGAMRSRGHHASAFIGRRHFDDPNLIERYFERSP